MKQKFLYDNKNYLVCNIVIMMVEFLNVFIIFNILIFWAFKKCLFLYSQSRTKSQKELPILVTSYIFRNGTKVMHLHRY